MRLPQGFWLMCCYKAIILPMSQHIGRRIFGNPNTPVLVRPPPAAPGGSLQATRLSSGMLLPPPPPATSLSKAHAMRQQPWFAVILEAAVDPETQSQAVVGNAKGVTEGSGGGRRQWCTRSRPFGSSDAAIPISTSLKASGVAR
jgi:hypothetical protein